MLYLGGRIPGHTVTREHRLVRLTMAKKTVKCFACGVAVKVDSPDDKAGEDVMCRQCEISEKMEQMAATQMELVNQVGRLQNELEAEREIRKAIGERLKAAEEKLSSVAGLIQQSACAPVKEGRSLSPNAADVANSTKKTGDRHSYREASLKEGNKEASRTPSVRQDNEGQDQATSPSEMQNVIIAGDSNLARCSKAITERVKGDKRVAIGVFPGQTMGSVIQRAKANLLGKAQGQNLVIVAGGLNDALKRQGGGLAHRLAKGVDELRAVSPQVRIAVCTVPEVPLCDINVQRAVVATNKAIWRVGREKGFEVIEINREVHRWGGFERDGIHFNHRLGHEVGFRLAGRAVAFLGGTRKLRSPG